MQDEKFKVTKFEQTQFWAVYNEHISQKLNKKWSEVSNAMQKVFQGKLNVFKVSKNFIF